MIIWGSYMMGKRDVVHGFGFCENCGQYGRLKSYSGRKWGHLYFIPLIPGGPPSRIVKKCPSCDHGMHIPDKHLPAMKADLKKSLSAALTALAQGQATFSENGEETTCASCLEVALELLHHLGEGAQVDAMKATLREKGLTYVLGLVEGRQQEVAGRMEQACKAYAAAVQDKPDDETALLLLGGAQLRGGDIDGAQATYEHALQVADDKLAVLDPLLGIYEAQKNWSRQAEAYELGFQLAPQITQDKKVMKAYKKACKKAGRQPAV